MAKINGAGETVTNPFGGDIDAFDVAVDPVGHEVYLDDETSVEAFSLDGVPIEGSGTGAGSPVSVGGISGYLPAF